MTGSTAHCIMGWDPGTTVSHSAERQWSSNKAPDNSNKASERADTQTPPDLVLMDIVKSFLEARGLHRSHLRGAIVRKLKEASPPLRITEGVIQTLLKSNKPGRLDDTIDILSQMGPNLYSFAPEILWRRQGEQARDPDLCYVVVRSLGRVDHSSKEPFALWASTLSEEAAREAVVQTLGETDAPWSKALLDKIAREDTSDFIRDLARETLADNFA